MRSWLTKIFIPAVLVATSLIASVHAETTPHAEVDLMSEKEAVAPGTAQRVGIRFKLESGWHIYWKNPGDSGLPVKLEWSLPPGVKSKAVDFPTPEKILVSHLVNYGYAEDTLVSTMIQFPTSLRPGDSVKLSVKGKWLICKEECVPGRAQLSLSLPVVESSKYAATPGTSPELFHGTETALPRPMSEIKLFSVDHHDLKNGKGEFILKFGRIADVDPGKVFFFAEDNLTIPAGSPQVFEDTVNSSFLKITQAEYKPIATLKGVLKVGDGLGYEISYPFNPSGAIATQMAAAVEPSLWLMLFFAFLGGLILNLMPCILPVLTLKVMSMVSQSSDAHSAQKFRRHGIAYGAGILTSFWVLAGILIAVRAGGSSLGWGFQLQSPLFISALSLLFFFMGLNLMGVFEVGSRAMGVGSSLANARGYAGSFFTGVLTTVAATPCSAPFMGTALGFALTQSPSIAFLTLTILGLGLAAPYVLFTFFPGASLILPRPGEWMIRFKQLLAFPLLGTAIWLITILSSQAGTEGVRSALTIALLVYLLIWIAPQRPVKHRWRIFRYSLILLATIGIGMEVQTLRTVRNPDRVQEMTHGLWKVWSKDALARGLAEKKTVLVNLTADWCVTCKVNENLVFESEAVRAELQKGQVLPLMGDWTNGDDAITQYMAEFNRNSVPIYLLYKRGNPTPEILPQLLTRSGLIEKLNE